MMEQVRPRGCVRLPRHTQLGGQGRGRGDRITGSGRSSGTHESGAGYVRAPTVTTHKAAIPAPPTVVAAGVRRAVHGGAGGR